MNDTKAYEIQNVLSYNPGGRSLLLESVSKVSSAANSCSSCAGFAMVSVTVFDVFVGGMPDGSWNVVRQLVETIVYCGCGLS